ncbi:MAG: helix-turn-helix domain-containing protein, partial [Wenzhouxiangellaceae bacterium]
VAASEAAQAASNAQAEAEAREAAELQPIRDAVAANAERGEYGADALARRLGMSRSVLYRRVSELGRSSPAELVRELRLKRAAELLTETDEQISTIAYTCGFRSVSAFSRAFSKLMGTTPRGWRKRATG